jgi:glycosyltransferase involved in cell wall biosynthesis
MPNGVHNAPETQLHVLLLMPLAEQRGGAELALGHLLRHGRALGVRWHLVFFEDGPMVTHAREIGVAADVIPVGRLRQPWQMARSTWRVAKLARAIGADAIFSWMGKAHMYGGPAAVLAGVPAGWFQHGMPSQGSTIDALTTLLPAKLVCCCSRTSAAAQARLWPRRPTQVVHPAVDLREFDRTVVPSVQGARRKLHLPLDVPVIGMVGRLQRWKGFHVLIEAMPHILRVHPDAHCVLVGGEHAFEPDYAGYLHDRISSLQLRQHVTLAGLQRNVPDWMQAMDVFIHASDREPFGMVVVEAMALGKPVVAGAEAGPTEIITPGVDGLLASYGNVEQLADAVIRFLDAPDFAARVGDAARQRAQAFSAERFAAQVTGAIRTIVAARTRSRTELFQANLAPEKPVQRDEPCYHSESPENCVRPTQAEPAPN